MKRRKMIKTIIMILLFAVMIIILIKFTSSKKEDIERLALLYDELNKSQTYLFKMEKNEDGITIMAKKEDKTIIDNQSKDSHSTTIVKDNNTYLVLHDREEYYVYEQNNVEQSILTDGLGEVVIKEFVTGTEKIKGKKYLYEEYRGSTIFMEESVSNLSEDEIRTRFYFDDNNNLTYIKTIKGSYQELLKIDIQKEVDETIFEIPSHYAEG